MPVCNSTTIQQNEAIAQIDYQGVRVLVIATTPNSITFTALRQDPVTGAVTTGTFTVPWGDRQVTWPPCPSTLPSTATAADDGPPPAAGASGELFLAEPFVTANNIVVTTPKWPQALPAQPYRTITIWPTSVILTGIIPGIDDPIEASVNLLDTGSARPGQTLALGNDPVELELSPESFGAFGVAPPATANLAPWPWSALSAAVAEIDDVARDPRERAHAWAVVAACTEQFIIAKHTDELVTEEQVQALRRLLPNHPLFQ